MGYGTIPQILDECSRYLKTSQPPLRFNFLGFKACFEYTDDGKVLFIKIKIGNQRVYHSAETSYNFMDDTMAESDLWSMLDSCIDECYKHLYHI